MSASSADERLYWVQCIQNSIREHPFHDIITSKKDALRRQHDSGKTSHPASLPSTVGSGTPLANKHSNLQGQQQQGPGTPATPIKAGGNRSLFKGHITAAAPKTSTPLKKQEQDHENNNSALLGDKLI